MKKGVVFFFFQGFLDEFADLTIIYLDVRCLCILEIVMEDSDTSILMRLQGEKCYFLTISASTAFSENTICSCYC